MQGIPRQGPHGGDHERVAFGRGTHEAVERPLVVALVARVAPAEAVGHVAEEEVGEAVAGRVPVEAEVAAVAAVLAVAVLRIVLVDILGFADVILFQVVRVAIFAGIPAVLAWRLRIIITSSPDKENRP